MTSYLPYSILSGLLASVASGLGKFAFSSDQGFSYAVRICCILLFIFCNLAMWFCFTRALKFADSTVKPVIINTSVNFISTGLIGLMFFGETHGLLWWLGLFLILTGIFCVQYHDPISKKDH